MNNDTTILLLIAEQHSEILGLRNENTALHQRIRELETEIADQAEQAEQEKSSAPADKGQRDAKPNSK